MDRAMLESLDREIGQLQVKIAQMKARKQRNKEQDDKIKDKKKAKDNNLKAISDRRKETERSNKNLEVFFHPKKSLQEIWDGIRTG
jgi:hypothetical protein